MASYTSASENSCPEPSDSISTSSELGVGLEEGGVVPGLGLEEERRGLGLGQGLEGRRRGLGLVQGLGQGLGQGLEERRGSGPEVTSSWSWALS